MLADIDGMKTTMSNILKRDVAAMSIFPSPTALL